MEIETVTYAPDSGMLRVKCSGRFGQGSEGRPSGELLARTVERWIADHADQRVQVVQVDYTEVDYSWGDWPVSSLVPFVRHGVARCHLIAGPSNYDSLKGLLEACHVPWFMLSHADDIEGKSVWTPSLLEEQPTARRDQTTLHVDQLDILDEAISDVGYWRRWLAELPEWVQLEFGGVQLAAVGTDIDLPRPIQTLVLRFFRPSCVAFMLNRNEWDPVLIGRRELESDVPGGRDPLGRGPSPPTDLPTDWPLLLRQEEIGPLQIRPEMFTFRDVDIAAAIMAEGHAVHSLVGAMPAVDTWSSSPAHIAFWAGAAGVVIAAEAMETLAESDPMSIGDVDQMRHAWFDYWKQYWKRRGHKEALPIDWTCEATIPTWNALD